MSVWRPMDCSGLCYPEPAGTSTDEAMAFAAEATGRRALNLARSERPGVPDQVLAALEALTPLHRSRLFASPLAALDAIDPAAQRQEACNDPRTPQDRAAVIWRHLIGHPDGPSLTLVLGPGSIPAEGLVLPHLDAVLLPAATPLGVSQDEACLWLISADGAAVTLPRGTRLPSGFSHPLLRRLPMVGQLPVLNAAPELRACFGPFGLLNDAGLADAQRDLQVGVALLATAWPEAHAALQRHVRGLLLLSRREFERSHTPATLPGTVLLTVGRPETVADLLCHETSHIRAQPFLDLDPLVETLPGGETEFDSPWRTERRPMRGILLGVHAFLNVCTLYARLAGTPAYAPAARAIYARQRANVQRGHATLLAHGRPTKLGRDLMQQLNAAVDALAAREAP